jgi:hypothetical protein
VWNLEVLEVVVGGRGYGLKVPCGGLPQKSYPPECMEEDFSGLQTQDGA